MSNDLCRSNAFERTIEAIAQFAKKLRNCDESFAIFLVSRIAEVLNKRDDYFDTNFC